MSLLFILSHLSSARMRIIYHQGLVGLLGSEASQLTTGRILMVKEIPPIDIK